MGNPTAGSDLQQQDREREPRTLDCEVNQTAIQRPSTHAHLRHASPGLWRCGHTHFESSDGNFGGYVVAALQQTHCDHGSGTVGVRVSFNTEVNVWGKL